MSTATVKSLQVSFREQLLQNPAFEFRNGVFYDKEFNGAVDFTNTYLKIRDQEQRAHDDATVSLLPEVSEQSKLSTEWLIRKRSTDRLIRYLGGKSNLKIIEIGCGNGWLLNYMSKYLHSDFVGIDINEPELQQAARLFGKANISFVHSDILKSSSAFKADIIILAATIQYFSDFEMLIQTLLKSLNPDGEIHILDSPFYSDEEGQGAKRRGVAYFAKSKVEEMEKYYYYHNWSSLRKFLFELMYNPNSVLNRIWRQLVEDSPFPWIRITKQ